MRRCAYIAIVLAGILTFTGVLFSTHLFGENCAFGICLWISRGDSMLPTTQNGALSLVHHCHMEDVKVGDVVLYWYEPDEIYIGHRVVEKGEDYLITRGDANPDNDLIPVTGETLLGKEILYINCFAPIIRLGLEKGIASRRLLFAAALILAYIIWAVPILICYYAFGFSRCFSDFSAKNGSQKENICIR